MTDPHRDSEARPMVPLRCRKGTSFFYDAAHSDNVVLRLVGQSSKDPSICVPMSDLLDFLGHWLLQQRLAQLQSSDAPAALFRLANQIADWSDGRHHQYPAVVGGNASVRQIAGWLRDEARRLENTGSLSAADQASNLRAMSTAQILGLPPDHPVFGPDARSQDRRGTP